MSDIFLIASMEYTGRGCRSIEVVEVMVEGKDLKARNVAVRISSMGQFIYVRQTKAIVGGGAPK